MFTKQVNQLLLNDLIDNKHNVLVILYQFIGFNQINGSNKFEFGKFRSYH